MDHRIRTAGAGHDVIWNCRPKHWPCGTCRSRSRGRFVLPKHRTSIPRCWRPGEIRLSRVLNVADRYVSGIGTSLSLFEGTPEDGQQALESLGLGERLPNCPGASSKPSSQPSSRTSDCRDVACFECVTVIRTGAVGNRAQDANARATGARYVKLRKDYPLGVTQRPVRRVI